MEPENDGLKPIADDKAVEKILDGAGEAFAAGDYNEARRLYEEVPPGSSFYEKALAGLVKISYVAGDMEKAAEFCKNACKINAGFSIVKSLYHLEPENFEKMMQMTRAFSEMDLHRHSLELVERLLELPISPDQRIEVLEIRKGLSAESVIPELSASESQYRKTSLMMKKSVNVAIALFIAVILAGVGYFVYTVNRSSIKSGRTALDNALQLKEQFKSTELHDDKVFRQLKDAENIFRRVAADGQRHERALARFYLARVYGETAGMLELVNPTENRAKCAEYRIKVKDELNKAIGEDPKYPEAHIELAFILLKEKDSKGAAGQLELAQKAIDNLGEAFKSRTDPLKEKIAIISEKLKNQEETDEKPQQK